MSSVLHEILQRTRLEEGLLSLEQLILALYLDSGLSTKQLANTLLLPLPVTAAVKKELVRYGLLAAGSALTDRGRRYVEEEMCYAGLDREAYRQAHSSSCTPAGLFGSQWPAIEEIFSQRPAVETRIDQSHCTAETSMRRALMSLRYGALINKELFCAGDDDLVAISLCLLLRKLFPREASRSTVYVLDIDRRYLDFIDGIARDMNLPIHCRCHDMRKPLPADLTGRFDCAFTDPPYTASGLALFLSRVAAGLKPVAGLPVMLSFAHRPPPGTLALQRHLVEMGFVIDSILPRFNRYEGAAVLGSMGQLLVLRTTSDMADTASGVYTAPIYTGEMRQTQRLYRCRRCKKSIRVGAGRQYETIELLKQAGCPHCHGTVFDRK